MRRAAFAAALALSSCIGGRASETLSATPTAVVMVEVTTPMSVAPAFAGEHGALFIEPSGQLVRVGLTGLHAAVEPHPGNPTAPGPATALWPIGPAAALAVTSAGLFRAEGGWLTTVPWQSKLSAPGLVATAVGADGAGWLAHQAGVFQLVGDGLAELQLDGAPITEVTALAAGPTPDARQGVWFAQGTRLTSAAEVSSVGYLLADAELGADELAPGVTGLAGVSPTPSSPGELWVMTPKALFHFTVRGWRRLTLAHQPRALRSAGRFVWLEAGESLYRYDADEGAWREAAGLEPSPKLLAVDAAGTAWVRAGLQTLRVGFDAPPRVHGLVQGETVYDTQLSLGVTVPTTPAPTAVTRAFDDNAAQAVDLSVSAAGTGLETGLTRFGLAGLDASEAPLPVSVTGLGDGLHTLEVTAQYGDGSTSRRRLTFRLAGTAQREVSWEHDIRPLSAAHCDRCHANWTSPELRTFEQWKALAVAIGESVKARRMPADRAMLAEDIQTIERWVLGGTLP